MSSELGFSVAAKQILVTGGTRGIGRSISERLVGAGAHVVACYARNDAAAEETQHATAEMAGELSLCRADITRKGAMQKLEQALDGKNLDGLIHCAATGVHGNLDKLTGRHLDWTYSLNVKAFFEMVKTFSSRMNSGSSIVALSSEGAQHAVQDYALVGSSKAALESLCRHLAVELAPRNIRVNCLSPGVVLTESWQVLPDAAQRLENARSHAPTGHLTSSEEVAAVAHFLCSDSSSGVNGQVLVVDGGSRIRGV